MIRLLNLLFLFVTILYPEVKTIFREFGIFTYRGKYVEYKHLNIWEFTLINYIYGIAFFFELLVRHNKMFQEMTSFASHILH